VLWGTSIVGFGSIVPPGSGGKNATPWPLVAFSPRKTEMVLYLNTEIEADRFDALGPHRRGVGCLYVKRLMDIDQTVLVSLIERSVTLARQQNS
jgi:hypothetical protein